MELMQLLVSERGLSSPTTKKWDQALTSVQSMVKGEAELIKSLDWLAKKQLAEWSKCNCLLPSQSGVWMLTDKAIGGKKATCVHSRGDVQAEIIRALVICGVLSSLA